MPVYRNNLIATTLTFFTYITQSKLRQQIAYLKAENEILRNRIPGRIQTTPAERALLVRLAKPLRDAVQELVSIVHFKTLLRWIREETTLTPQRTTIRAGRPSIPENTVALILRMALDARLSRHHPQDDVFPRETSSTSRDFRKTRRF